MPTRREILTRSGLALAGLATASCANSSFKRHDKSVLSFGLVTDLHYADTEARGIRYYSESAGKLDECVQLMNDRKVNFLVELGDFKDLRETASEESALRDLSTIESVFSGFDGPRYHVLGNHDMDCISKSQFHARTANTGIPAGASYYSFDCKGVHFIALDANYTSDGSDYGHGQFSWTDSNIPPKQLTWLEHDLASTRKPVIVFIHQQLDPNGGFSVRNAEQVRSVLEKSRKVLAVFQGHCHDGFYSQIEGIHYYTHKAAVDGSGELNNAYSIIEVHQNKRIVVSGYRKATSTALVKA